MTVEKMVVDFVMKGARFRVKDQGHQQLSEIQCTAQGIDKIN